jgi:SSS family solute:Na+ symporter
MHPLDLILTFLPLLVVLIVGLYAQSYVKSVADFMSGGRSAGRYLLAVAGGELQAGAVVFVALFEIISHTGFTLTWWSWISAPVWVIVGISGFVIYRYRETRAMTLAQFFEIRYNKSFRLFTGFLGFIAGILNFGIIPVIGARCMVYFLGLPPVFTVFSHVIPTYIPLMALFLSLALFVALSGGVITLLIISCI